MAAAEATTVLEQKHEFATRSKKLGNTCFKKQKYTLAIRCYKRGLVILRCPSGCEYLNHEWDFIKSLYIELHLNLAACYLKNDCINLDAAVLHCSIVLESQESDNVKALYRRSLAYGSMNDYASAKADISQAISIDPLNKALRNQLTQLVSKEQEYSSRTYRHGFLTS